MKVPAELNVCWYVLVAASWPLSHPVPSLVVVCVAGPLLVHVTVVPSGTVVQEGAKLKSAIVIWLDMLVHPPPPPPPPPPYDVGVLELPQAVAVKMRADTRNRTDMRTCGLLRRGAEDLPLALITG